MLVCSDFSVFLSGWVVFCVVCMVCGLFCWLVLVLMKLCCFLCEVLCCVVMSCFLCMRWWVGSDCDVIDV